MNSQFVEQLKSLNRKFYSEVAVDFDKSREKPWSGWKKFKDEILIDKFEVSKCLDIACGNARFGTFLSTFSPSAKYVGVDFSRELIEAAKIRLQETNLDYKLIESDVLSNWDDEIQGEFDLVVLFGILHHIPGLDNRKKLVEKAAQKLTKGGFLVLTAWQIPLFKRFENKMLSDKFIQEELGIDTKNFEENDFILDWKRGNIGYRYTHYSSPEEIQYLTKDTGLKIISNFESDGRTENVNMYYVLSKLG